MRRLLARWSTRGGPALPAGGGRSERSVTHEVASERLGACGILVRVVVAGWAAIVAGGPGARAGDGPEDATRLLVETIDRLIAAGWAEHRVEPAAPADDAEFLRRVSLDLAGRIPSAGEAHEFLEDPSPEKRRRLVDRLLAGPAYVAHFTTIERRLMIPEADTNRQLQLARAGVRGLAPPAGRRECRL